eukprot:437471-Lingulodinium_polyedra.AAC.1
MGALGRSGAPHGVHPEGGPVRGSTPAVRRTARSPSCTVRWHRTRESVRPHGHSTACHALIHQHSNDSHAFPA